MAPSPFSKLADQQAGNLKAFFSGAPVGAPTLTPDAVAKLPPRIQEIIKRAQGGGNAPSDAGRAAAAARAGSVVGASPKAVKRGFTIGNLLGGPLVGVLGASIAGIRSGQGNINDVRRTGVDGITRGPNVVGSAPATTAQAAAAMNAARRGGRGGGGGPSGGGGGGGGHHGGRNGAGGGGKH